ncbi:sarcosine oxidase [Aspergillus luchuensis]|uniref:Sarcosine oxidase n=1 Tax=Aspergillus kawachii TaxID=1069201 RepID=A0A146F5E5_ASPKA|nr:sarcosine oxidase [Aspergillus luchuensis]
MTHTLCGLGTLQRKLAGMSAFHTIKRFRKDEDLFTNSLLYIAIPMFFIQDDSGPFDNLNEIASVS